MFENVYVIKNLHNGGYYKGRGWIEWASDIDDAAKFENLGGIQDEVNFYNMEGFDIFDGVYFQIVAIHILNKP